MYSGFAAEDLARINRAVAFVLGFWHVLFDEEDKY